MATSGGMAPWPALEVVTMPRTNPVKLKEATRQRWMRIIQVPVKRKIFPILLEVKEDPESQEGNILGLD